MSWGHGPGFWSYLDAVVQERILQSETRTTARLMRITQKLETLLSRSEELSAELVELGSAVDGIDTFIKSLPTAVEDITQEQLDQLRGSTTRLVSLAQAAPEVPTDPAPVDDIGL